MKYFLFLIIVIQTILSIAQGEKPIPTVTSEQRENILSPPNGFLVFDSTLNTYWLYDANGKKWVQLTNTQTQLTKINNTTPVYEDITIPVTSTRLYGSKEPTFDRVINDGNKSHGVFTYWFDWEGNEELFFTVQIPHCRKEGSDIFPHIHWLALKDLGEKKVRWSMEYSWTNVSDYFGNTTTISSNKALTNQPHKALKHIITDLGAIPGKDKRISSMLICRIYRDAEAEDDTFEEEAGLLQIDFHYEIDSEGSREQWKK